jgi:glycogen debranching enzyme
MRSAGQPISERVMLKRDSFFAVSAPDGSMRPGEFSGDGLWSGDTRLLSHLRLLVDGVEPRPVAVEAAGVWASFELEADRVNVTRLRFVDGGLHEKITVSNPGAGNVDPVIELEVASDFAAILGIRGVVSELRSPASVPPAKTVEGVRFARDGGTEYASRVKCMPEGLKHQLRLGPGESFTWQVDVVPEANAGAISFESRLQAVNDEYPRWKAECMSIHTDNTDLNRVLDKAISDLRMLCNSYETGIYPTAGLPWYVVPFGRDALISCILLLHVNPEIGRGVLRYQARHQGTRVDPDNEEEPGKILHEVRMGEAVERGLWPHILYGTADATALFLCALTEAETWTNDSELLRELAPAAEAALEWCRKYGDSDGDGYIEYRGGRARNQGWKDSDTSLTNTDGTEAALPAALCEVQAYLYRGLIGMSRTRPALKQKAAELRRRFNHDFWMHDERYFAQALDGSKHQVQAITSNPGHCLWMGIVDRSRAAHVAARLVSPELFSGWGIRTLSERAINYDPGSYHNGSVWPFDTALAVAGLRQYGFAAEAERIARALLEASSEFALRRPPELFCGDVREPGKPPREFGNTCTPQLWSSAAMFTCVSSILGLEADLPHRTLRVAPVKTPLWNRIEISGLHFLGQRIDFAVDSGEVTVGRLPAGIRVEAGPPHTGTE